MYFSIFYVLQVYVETPVGIAFDPPEIKVKVTVTEIEKKVSGQ
jgi:hypothetical protein